MNVKNLIILSLTFCFFGCDSNLLRDEKKNDNNMQNNSQQKEENIFSEISITNNKTNNGDIKIIATLGKNGWERINDYCLAGVNIFRINGSHIKNEDMLKEMILKVNENIKNSENCKNAEVMYDTQGPEIRVLVFENKKDKKGNKIGNFLKKKKQKNDNNNSENYGIEIKRDDMLVFHTNLEDVELFKNKNERKKDKNNVFHVGVNYKDFVNDVMEGMDINIEARSVYAKVEKIDKEKGTVETRIISVNGEGEKYLLTDRRHINLFGAPVSLKTLTENDVKYIKMSALNNVKYFAISFVREQQDIVDVKEVIEKAFVEQNANINEEELKNKIKDIRVIAKIETQQGLDNIEEITKTAEGVMVARGDLSSEIPVEEVPYAKQTIIETSNKYNKFSIMATDVLESLTRQNIPSKNDVDAIANSLNLGANCLMLSNETTQQDLRRAINSINVLVDNIKMYKIKLEERKVKQKNYSDNDIELQQKSDNTNINNNDSEYNDKNKEQIDVNSK